MSSNKKDPSNQFGQFEKIGILVVQKKMVIFAFYFSKRGPCIGYFLCHHIRNNHQNKKTLIPRLERFKFTWLK
jgi:hypothetical protein